MIDQELATAKDVVKIPRAAAELGMESVKLGAQKSPFRAVFRCSRETDGNFLRLSGQTNPEPFLILCSLPGPPGRCGR